MLQNDKGNFYKKRDESKNPLPKSKIHRNCPSPQWRQCGPVVRAFALRPGGDPGFKTRSDHSLNLFLVVPGSTSQVHL